MNLEHDRDKILKEHPEWFSVNRNGKSLADTTAYVGYYKFLCPALPEVREFIKEKIKAYCEVEGLNGIAIDYHRFVDVVLPTTLWPRYGIVQDREYAAWVNRRCQYDCRRGTLLRQDNGCLSVPYSEDVLAHGTSGLGQMES